MDEAGTLVGWQKNDVGKNRQTVPDTLGQGGKKTAKKLPPHAAPAPANPCGLMTPSSRRSRRANASPRNSATFRGNRTAPRVARSSNASAPRRRGLGHRRGGGFFEENKGGRPPLT